MLLDLEDEERIGGGPAGEQAPPPPCPPIAGHRPDSRRTPLQIGPGMHTVASVTGWWSARIDSGQPRVHEVQEVTSDPPDAPEEVQRFVERMTREERMLVVLKRELYEGSWDEMVADLRARLDGRPYIFKLAHRIADDLERIERLREVEQHGSVDLSDYVQLEL